MKTKAMILGLAAAAASALSFTMATKGYEPGAEAADFSLKNVDGKMVSMADYKDAKGFIVVFTCNHCPFAKKYESRILALDKKFKKDYPVIAINSNDSSVVPDDSYDKMQELAKSKKYTFPYLYDQSQSVAKAFGATKTPHVYVLHKENGKLIVKYVGAIDDNTESGEKATKKYVEEAIKELKAGKEVTTKTSKAVGCSIKWKQS